jgi:hypothetical protein
MKEMMRVSSFIDGWGGPTTRRNTFKIHGTTYSTVPGRGVRSHCRIRNWGTDSDSKINMT